MRSRRLLLIVILILGVVLLAVTAVLLLNQDEPTQTADGPTPTPDIAVTLDPTLVAEENIGQLVDVVVSVQTVPRGFQMTAAELAVEKRLASEVAPNVIFNIDQAVGLYARTDIFQGETITIDSLVADPTLIGETSYGPSSLIPFGLVAQSIPMDRLSSIAYAVNSGDTVDIMFTIVVFEIDEELGTLLPNAATFNFVTEGEDGQATVNAVSIFPYGRFEQSPTGSINHIYPSEIPRPLAISFVLQNARVIQVGNWLPPQPPPPPTPTPDPEGPTPTPIPPTPVPPPPDVVLLAMPPQNQLLLKYALEHGADVDLALRGEDDFQPYTVENITELFLAQQYNVDIPTNFAYALEETRIVIFIPLESITDSFDLGEEAGDGE